MTDGSGSLPLGLPNEPAEFLRQFQSLLAYKPEFVDWIPRKDRFDELDELGLTQNQATSIIQRELCVDHYHSGPQPDDHKPTTGTVCVFRCLVEGTSVYIKIGLRLTNVRGQFRGVIWSFKRATAEKKS